jgi:uncharacterized membrane-anchored protein
MTALLPARKPRDKSPANRSREPLAPKVPEIAAIFWVLKILTTGVGESASDFLGQVSVPLAGLIGISGIVVALRMQFRTREYRAPVYWLTVMMVAVFGTMVADGVKDGAGISYVVSTAVASIAVATVFYLWWRSEGTLSIHSINSRRREKFYWAAVLATFALGTAAGDLTAITLNIGFFGSAVLFAGLIAIPALAWWKLSLDPVIAFWACYVLTRPLGASFADWFGKPASATGLGLGDGVVTAIGVAVFAALVAYITTRERKQSRTRAFGGAFAAPVPSGVDAAD